MKKSMSVRRVLAPTFSIGIDLGADRSVYCLVDKGGVVIETSSFAMEPKEVRELFGSVPAVTIVLEACNQSAWMSRLLEELGHRVLVCNPRRLKLIASSTLKTDKLDAEVLGRLARLAQLDPELVDSITVRSRATQLMRAELRGREQLVAGRARMISFVRSVLRGDAIRIPTCDADHFASKIKRESLPADVWPAIEHQVEAIAALTRQLQAIEKRPRTVARDKPEVARLMGIDGVGLLTALSFVLCIEDPSRFSKSRDVGPYLGLVPSLRQSSTVERRGPITKAGDAGMRRLLVQAALVLLVRCKHDSALKRWALGIAERRGHKKARVALARKLAIIMHYVWASGEEYRRLPREVSLAA